MTSNRPNPLSNPGFPGVAETEAVPVGSNQPVRVRIQRDENAPTLSPTEFRKASARQKQLDAQFEAGKGMEEMGFEPKVWTQDMPPARQTIPMVPVQKRRGRPLGSSRKSQAQSPTSPQMQVPAQVTNFDRVEALESRVGQIESGINKVLELLSQRPHNNPLAPKVEPVSPYALERAPEVRPVPETEDDPDWDEDDAAWLDSLKVEAPEVEAEDLGVAPPVVEEGDPTLIELQQFIQKRNPHKWFRRFWYSVCRNAAYQEWPVELQQRFDETFNQIVFHPAFLHQVRKFARKSRNGQTIGNEQLFKVATHIAGCASIYRLMGD